MYVILILLGAGIKLFEVAVCAEVMDGAVGDFEVALAPNTAIVKHAAAVAGVFFICGVEEVAVVGCIPRQVGVAVNVYIIKNKSGAGLHFE